MTEQYSDIGSFDSETVSEALAADTRAARDVAHGDGQAVDIGDGKLVLEVYPDAAVARVTTQDARVELFRVPGYSVDVDRGRVVFEQGQDDDRSRLIVRGDGKMSFVPVLRGTDSSQIAGSQRTDANPISEATTTSETATSSDDQSTENGETESVTLQGRLGRDPWFRGGEQPRGGFPLAVNAEDNTTWHKVVVFDQTAETLQEQFRRGDVRKGRLVDVTGQTVTREEETARGAKKIVEFHATQVSRVRATAKRPDARA
jgi:hypothetical protein